MYLVPETTEKFSFEPLGSTSSFWTWLFCAWNTLDVNEQGDRVHHTGVRIAGCRYDTWQVTPKKNLVDQDIEEIPECSSCGEGMPKNECPNSQRPCGHHCNHSWSHDSCCWCGIEFGEEFEGIGTSVNERGI